MKLIFATMLLTGLMTASCVEAQQPILTGADQTETYLPLLKGKRVGMMVNPTSIIGSTPIVDSLLNRGVKIKMIFGPEHGFRNNASNGTEVADEVDKQTGIPVISLYGNRRKPTPAQMAALDVLIFDLQDVAAASTPSSIRSARSWKLARTPTSRSLSWTGPIPMAL